MKWIIYALFLVSSLSAFGATEIILSSKIKKKFKNSIIHDLEVLDNFEFRSVADIKTLRVLGIAELNSDTVGTWLNQRVKYIVEENAFSKKKLHVEKYHVQYPNSQPQPFSSKEEQDGDELEEISSIIMTNIGAEIYMQGKNQHQLYGVKIPQSKPHKPIYVRLDTPRAGILQIGAGLFSANLAINRMDENAVANSIMRLAFYFHEGRHSDGHGTGLGFTHSVCPKGHDYENEFACDESLNGAYSVGAAMAREMMMACNTNCSERDKEMLKIFLIDNYNRVQTKTHLNTAAKYWDPTPEKL